MVKIIFKRIILFIITFIGISFITFLVINLSPGKPSDMLEFSSKITYEAKEKIIKLYGLDKPLHIRYFNWFVRFIKLDFGNSFKDDRPVIKKILERLPATLLLNILSLILIFFFGIFFGIICAVYRNKFLDKIISFFIFLSYSIPKYWLAILCMIVFGIKLKILPISGLRSVNFEYLTFLEKCLDIIKHLILPVVISALGGIAGLTRYIRGSMIEQLNSEYIKFAISKGTPKNKVVLKHAFRNVLIPVVTIVGLSLPEVIGGAFIFETIFAYPGMGRLGYEAIMSRDYPLIMGISVITAFLTLLGNFLADLLYIYVDPRVRYK
ncbi:MAG: ABC transporter permease [Elusimicrobiota bacterium]|nr:ABC transporter permease [Endomicrobiia bacterium]MCX7910310.1 ABC transporter permease [Endomicrobiia bacterium]MDW8165214.1 ABC transporter permease [Elusimicrobiota bacterium]